MNPYSPSRRKLVAEIENYNDAAELLGTAWGVEDSVRGALYNEDSFSSKVSSEIQRTSLNLKMNHCITAPRENRNQNIDGSMISFRMDTRLADVGDTKHSLSRHICFLRFLVS